MFSRLSIRHIAKGVGYVSVKRMRWVRRFLFSVGIICVCPCLCDIEVIKQDNDNFGRILAIAKFLFLVLLLHHPSADDAIPCQRYWCIFSRQTLSLGCHIHNAVYLTLSLTLTITLTLLTLTVTVRVTLTLPNILTLIVGTIVNMAP